MIKITLRNWASGFTIAVALFIVTGMMTISGCTDDSDQSELTSALNTLADDHNRADDNKTDHSKDDNSKDIENPVPSSTGPWPKAVTQETNYDFNRMRLGSKKDYEFTIKNEGDAPLKLKTGDPTCKCTKFKLSATEIAPGESETLLIEWHGIIFGKFTEFAQQFAGFLQSPTNVLGAQTTSLEEKKEVLTNSNTINVSRKFLTNMYQKVHEAMKNNTFDFQTCEQSIE